MASFSLRLKEHCADLPDLRTVYVGDSYRGQIIAGYNPAHLDTDDLTTHTTNVLRALQGLHSTVERAQASTYFISSNQQTRFIVQQVENTPLYLAFVTAKRNPLNAYLATFKQVLELCRKQFSEASIDIPADADA